LARRNLNLQQPILSRDHESLCPHPTTGVVAVRDDHLREQALGARGEKIEIELDQRSARGNAIAHFHPWPKTFAF
jgi:hypothetical protein